MTVSAKLSPRIFYDSFFYAFRERRIRNGLAVILPLLLIFNLFGLLLAASTAAGILGTLMVLYGFTTLFLYVALKNKARRLPMTYRLTSGSLKITYGDHASLLRFNKTLKKRDTQKAWVHGKWIYIKSTYATYRIYVPRDRRTKFILDMKKFGWFDTVRPTVKNTLVYNMYHVGMYVFVGLLFLATFWANAHITAAASSRLPTVVLNGQEILARLDSERAGDSLPVMETTPSLTQSTTKSCEAITGQNTPARRRNTSLTDGAVHTKQFYTDNWVTEIDLSVSGSTTANQVVAKWINNHDAQSAVLDGQYTTGAVATCDYSVHGVRHTVVVLQLTN